MTSEFNVEHTIGDIAPQAIVEEELRQLARKSDYDAGDERRLQRIKLLEKYKDRYPTRELADRLGSCRGGNRCMSAACPACSGHFLCCVALTITQYLRSTCSSGGRCWPIGYATKIAPRRLPKKVGSRA